jgi:hypothetical protein
MLIVTVYGEDSNEVHTIRSELLRMYEHHDTLHDHPDPLYVSPDVFESSDEVSLLKSSVSKSKLASHTRLASEFLDHAHKLIEIEIGIEARTELRKALIGIMQTAARFSSALDTQKSYLRCEGLSELPGTFDHQSEDMEAFSGHLADLDDEPTCLDGKAILLVIQPAVVLIGMNDGSDYKWRRVLKKAIVWMG